MQGAFEELRFSLWEKLKPIFDKYVNQETSEIETARVQEIVIDVLNETTPEEIHYVTKNMFRLDSDNNGTVSYLELGNFLFKRHCGEMSLQKNHRAGAMKHGEERKMLPEEFWKLINQAFSFLKVDLSREISDGIFKECDKDQDGKITYVEYFQFIDKYICFTSAQYANWNKSPEKAKPEPEPVEVDLGREWNSRLRLFLWLNLRKLYELFVCGRNLEINDANLRGLLSSILGVLSEEQLSYLINNLFKLKGTHIEFVAFAIIFLYLVAELGLSRYAENHPNEKKTLNKDEFLILLRNTFKFLSILRIKTSILLLIFAKIDKNNDGLITYDEYLRWVRLYIAVDVNRGDEYYIAEDDDAIEGQDILEHEKVFDVVKPASVQRKKIVFNFSNYDLSNRVRQRVLELLIPFDANKDKEFDEVEIKNALRTLLKENEYELPYVTRNVFRYDRNGDKVVTYDELTDFCVEQHFGEMAIQRLHRKNSYSRGKERIMNEQEFAFTLNNALGYIEFAATEAEIKLIFSEIDLEKSGWITYEVYFLFLKYYFGSLRIDGQKDDSKPPENDPDQEWLDSLKGLSGIDRFVRMLFDQLKNIFLNYDFNKNLKFETDEIEAILVHVFRFTQTEISYIINQFFNIESRRGKSLEFDELVRILLEIYFIEILLRRKFKDLTNDQWKARKLTKEEFISLVTEACFFLRKKPFSEDLLEIYSLIDTNGDGWVDFSEYVDFIRKYLGFGIQIQPVEPSGKPEDVSEEEWAFINALWSELKVYFDKYDSGSKGHLNENDLKRFVMEVLLEKTQRELDYIFWNLFRADPNSDCAIEFNEFAPFILNHAGEISLQKFHREQILGKSVLTENELLIVLTNAYSFLVSIPKSKTAVSHIYKRTGKGSDPSYGAYLSWVNRALARKFA